MWDTASPFVFDGPVPPDQIIGRQHEADTILDWDARAVYGVGCAEALRQDKPDS